MPKYQAVRGTKDILPADAVFFQYLESVARRLFRQFGFHEIRTPTFESVDLFSRLLGETTDVVQKEMYVFEDRGGRKLSLRPEGTAGVVRAFVEHHLSQTSPFCKLFYVGPMFRAERPQAGRYREFWQIGAEYFGNASPPADAEMLVLLETFFKVLGLPNVKLKLNSLGDAQCRPLYLEALKAYLKNRQATLCEDCQRRIDTNPLRALDCKIDGPTLVDAPTIDAYWCDPCRTHFTMVQELARGAGVAFVLTPRLVRGLDYYTRTVFEVTSSALGAQDALAAGGRYDRLVKEIGGPDTPALGFAMGVERAIQAFVAANGSPHSQPDRLVFVAAQGEAGAVEAFRLLQALRSSPELEAKGYVFEGGFFEKKLGAQLTMADRLKAVYCLLIGDDELAKGDVTIKKLASSQQQRVSQQDLVSFLVAAPLDA